MSSKPERKFNSDTKLDNDYEDNVNASHSKWNEREDYNKCHNDYDSSTVISESISGRSSDSCDFENGDVIPTTVLDQEIPSNISVQHSSDVLFGNKTVITGPVKIRKFIAQSDTLNVNQKDKSSDTPYASEIIEKKTTSTDRKLQCMHTFFRRRPAAIVTFVVGILIVIASALFGYFLIILKGQTSTGYEFVSKKDYDAMPRSGEVLPLNLPVKYVIIAHTEGENCTNLEKCKEVARHVQWYHMIIHGWYDVGLNFMIGGDGRVYEGRGYEEGAHTLGYNFDSVCISFIGNFTEYEAAEQQFVTAKLLIEEGLKENKIQSDYVLYAHRQIRGGDSPGKYVYNEIIKWKNWSEDVIPKGATVREV